VVKPGDFAQENLMRRVASQSHLLDITSLVETRLFVGIPDMLNAYPARARGEGSCRPRNGSIKLVAGKRQSCAGAGNRQLASSAADKAIVRRFADMKSSSKSSKTSAARTCSSSSRHRFPANDHLMEFAIITDALRRSSARRITAVIPYFGYARQDRKVGSRAPISAKLVANFVTNAGVGPRHDARPARRANPGLLRHPTDNLYASPVDGRDIKNASTSAR